MRSRNLAAALIVVGAVGIGAQTAKPRLTYTGDVGLVSGSGPAQLTTLNVDDKIFYPVDWQRLAVRGSIPPLAGSASVQFPPQPTHELSVGDSVHAQRSRTVTGLVVGGALGVAAGYALARHEIATCRASNCGAGPPLQIIIDPAILGAAGMLAGGIAGWVWSRH